VSADASGLREAIGQLVEQAGDQATEAIFDSLPVPEVTGELKDSGSWRYIGGSESSGQWEITFTAPQAGWTDEGTSPHVIEGNPVLVFNVGGTTVFARRVEHPGNAPSGWFTDSVTDDAWASEVQAAIDSLAGSV
jgi:hypothetical protein